MEICKAIVIFFQNDGLLREFAWVYFGGLLLGFAWVGGVGFGFGLVTFFKSNEIKKEAYFVLQLF